MANKSGVKYGIALSGGGARGIIHVGFLQALAEQDMLPTVVAGTNMGAVIGAFYCAGYEPSTIFQLLKDNGDKISLSLTNFTKGYRDLNILKSLLYKFIPVDDFSTFKYPLHISVTNLNQGINQIISEGPFYDYLIASAAIPILFKPRLIKNEYFCDGGLTNNFPVKPLIGKCDKIIGIHTNHISEKKEFKNLISINERIYQISEYNAVRNKISLCDYFIDPPEAKNFSIYDFHKADEIWRLGYREGIRFIQTLRKAKH